MPWYRPFQALVQSYVTAHLKSNSLASGDISGTLQALANAAAVNAIARDAPDISNGTVEASDHQLGKNI